MSFFSMFEKLTCNMLGTSLPKAAKQQVKQFFNLQSVSKGFRTLLATGNDVTITNLAVHA